jgi:surface protein
MKQWTTSLTNLVKSTNEYEPAIFREIKKKYVFQPQTKIELKDAITNWCYHNNMCAHQFGHPSLWNTSKITDMSNLFKCPTVCSFELCEHNRCRYKVCLFNCDINDWDVSNVTNMQCTFENCKVFNQPLNNWDVSKVKHMENMFSGAYDFDQDLSKWPLSLDVVTLEYAYNVNNCFELLMFDNCNIKNNNKPKALD